MASERMREMEKTREREGGRGREIPSRERGGGRSGAAGAALRPVGDHLTMVIGGGVDLF